MGILHRARRCPHGNHDMLLRREDGRLKWFCQKRGCVRQEGKKVKRGYLAGTFFEGANNLGMIKKVGLISDTLYFHRFSIYHIYGLGSTERQKMRSMKLI